MRTLIKLSSASEIDLSRWGLKTFCVCSHQVDNIIKWQPNAFGSWLPNRFKLASTFAESVPLTAPPPADFLWGKQSKELSWSANITLWRHHLLNKCLHSENLCAFSTFCQAIKMEKSSKEGKERSRRRQKVESKSCDVSYWPHHRGKLLKKTADSRRMWMWMWI